MLVKVNISLAIIREPPHRRRVWHFTQWQGLRLAGSPSSHQTYRLVSYRYFLKHQLILGILSKNLALSRAQIYPLSSSVGLPFLPFMVH